MKNKVDWEKEFDENFDFDIIFGKNSDAEKNTKSFIKSQIEKAVKEERLRILKDIEDTFYVKEQTHKGWLMTGLNIRLEDWNKFKLSKERK